MCMPGSSIVCGSSVSDHLKSLFLCFFLFPVYCAMGSSSCTHYYLSQPVREITCNPYHTLNAELCLECNTFGTGDYRVFWFHSIEGTITQQLADGQDGIDIDIDVIADFRHTELTIFNPQYNDIGYYWCQIGLLQRDNLTVTIDFLEQSQRILLLPMENYTDLPPCAIQGELDEPTVRCATDPPPEDVLTPLQSSRTPNWSYGLIAALAIALLIITILLLANLVAWKKIRRTNNSLSELHQSEVKVTVSTHQTSDITPNPRPPVPHRVLQVSRNTTTPPSVQEQTLHARSPPVDEEQIDRCSAMYAEAGNEGVRPIDMPYTSLDQHLMDGPTIYTPSMNYQQLNPQSIDEAHSYSSIQ